MNWVRVDGHWVEGGHPEAPREAVYVFQKSAIDSVLQLGFPVPDVLSTMYSLYEEGNTAPEVQTIVDRLLSAHLSALPPTAAASPSADPGRPPLASSTATSTGSDTTDAPSEAPSAAPGAPKPRLRAPLRKVDSLQGQCTICFERTIDTVLLECGHRCVCSRCAGTLSECPLDRRPITRWVKTYDPW
eukprot:gnl/Trimastix_PCT/3947.p1 GENE.gnl/Trimastix_PCT/3947~~gnl/Trimastix_PCT/3947.p1  ORF type:complete len:187 (-),score=13.17 gnl/Trimastix_PCT/3947:67-627(-)